MKTTRSLLPVAVRLALTLAALPASASDGHADVVAALATRAEVRAHMRACEDAAGQAAWQFRWAEYFWEGGNLAAFHEADAAVGASAPGERQALQDRIDADAARRGLARKAVSVISLGGADAAGCRELVGQISDHEHRHDLLGPGVFQRLDAAYAARQGSAEAVRREVQHEDMVIGCTKSQLRVGKHDFEPLHGFCACTIDAMTSSATPAEMDAYIASQSAPNRDKAQAMADLLKQPWMQNAIPKVKACRPAPQ
jgi:hypothetical protein